MARVDKGNAHVRKSARQDPAVQAADASRLVNDPAFITAYDAVHTFLIDKIEGLEMDGTAETAELERELCRSLRCMKGIKRALTIAGQRQKLRLADFSASTPETPEDT